MIIFDFKGMKIFYGYHSEKRHSNTDKCLTRLKTFLETKIVLNKQKHMLPIKVTFFLKAERREDAWQPGGSS